MKNYQLINHPINVTFDEILSTREDEFHNWCVQLREIIVDLWDNYDLPPRIGYSEEEMIDQFRQLESFPVNKFLVKDELTGEFDVIRNTHTLGNAVNDFFPTMMKTRINYTEDSDKGKSIYDFFADPSLLKTFITYATRHFKRDSFYHYSNPIAIGDTSYGNNLPFEQDSKKWIQKFEFNNGVNYRNKYDYWLAPIKDKEYTGYNEELKGKKYLILTKQDILEVKYLIPTSCMTNVDFNKSELYQIRIYEKGQRLFPIGLKAFRVSFCQYAVNYPPLTAKWVYDNFLPKGKSIVWDPSVGWGGRLLGCLSAKDDREITYLGTDPNTDHNVDETGETKYHQIYDYYCQNVSKGGMWQSDHNDFIFWQVGSEVIQYNLSFQEFKGKVDLVFTSPPYFAKEAYSEDEAQSYKKYPDYEKWKYGFLYETLKTAYDWLKPEGYLIWNISDVKFGNNMLPLVQDSLDFCNQLGFKYIKTIKMAMAQMPGGNRLDEESGLPKAKYFCKVNGLWLKYEPMLLFQK